MSCGMPCVRGASGACQSLASSPRYHLSTVECTFVYSLALSSHGLCLVLAWWAWCVPYACVLCVVCLLCHALAVWWVSCVPALCLPPCPVSCAVCTCLSFAQWVLCVSVCKCPVYGCICALYMGAYPACALKPALGIDLNKPQKTGIKSPIFFRGFSLHNFLKYSISFLLDFPVNFLAKNI